MPKAPVLQSGPQAEAIPESRLAQAIAHNILRNVAEMIHGNPFLNVAFQDETSHFSLAVARLEQESYSPTATLEAVRELYEVLQELLEAFHSQSHDPAFLIPLNLRDDFEAKVELVELDVRKELREEKVNEVAKQVILGKAERGINGVDLQIRKAVVAEIRDIIGFAMQGCVLELDGEDYEIDEILGGIKNSAILALVFFRDNLLITIKKAYPETGKNGQIATIILEVRKQIKTGEVPAPKKRRELKIEHHPFEAGLEGREIGTVMGLEAQVVRADLQRRTLPESTDAPADPGSSPDEK